MYFPVSRGSTKPCRLAWATVSQITGALFRCRRYVTPPGRTPISGMAYFCFNLRLSGMPIRRAVPSRRENPRQRSKRSWDNSGIFLIRKYTRQVQSHIYFPACHVSQGKKGSAPISKIFKRRTEKGESPVSRNNGRCEFLKFLGERSKSSRLPLCALNKLPTAAACRSARGTASKNRRCRRQTVVVKPGEALFLANLGPISATTSPYFLPRCLYLQDSGDKNSKQNFKWRNNRGVLLIMQRHLR